VEIVQSQKVEVLIEVIHSKCSVGAYSKQPLNSELHQSILRQGLTEQFMSRAEVSVPKSFKL